MGRYSLLLRSANAAATMAVLLLAAACTDRTIGPSLETLVQVDEVNAGEGPKATPGDRITVTYSAWLPDGTKVEQLDLTSRGKTHGFFIGDGTVIAGIDHAVRGMRVGSIRDVTLEPKAHWGSQGYGGVIPPETTLRFRLQLIAIDRNATPTGPPLKDALANS